MKLLRRLLGFARPEVNADDGLTDGAPAIQETPRPPVAPQRATPLPCPSCAVLLDPPPARDRLCPRCRQPIVVRRVEGRLALLTRAAVTVFEAERQRRIDERAWMARRQHWLRLARKVNASPARHAKLAAAPISADVVSASQMLYLSTAERAVKAARREKCWGDLGRIRREQARALFDEAGSPVPLPDEIAELHREGMTSVLRSLLPLAKHVEVVSVGCCPTCQADDGQVFPTAAEVRTARLPHAGCPRGLCGCDWWPATVGPGRRRIRALAAARRSPSPGPAPALEPEPSFVPVPGSGSTRPPPGHPDAAQDDGRDHGHRQEGQGSAGSRLEPVEGEQRKPRARRGEQDEVAGQRLGQDDGVARDSQRDRDEEAPPGPRGCPED